MTRREDCTSPSSDVDGSRPKFRCLSLKMRRRKRDIAKTKHNNMYKLEIWIWNLECRDFEAFVGKKTGSPHLSKRLLIEVRDGRWREAVAGPRSFGGRG
jgi:hypothetical protein